MYRAATPGYVPPTMHDAETRRTYPFLDLLEAEVDAVRAEALALEDGMWMAVHGYQTAFSAYVLHTSRWAHDFPSVDFAANRARCPRTAALVDRVPGVELAGFERVEPGGVMLPHTDPREDTLVRCILGVELTEEEQAWWPARTARLLDTRQVHWARNLGDTPRITLVLDVRMPFVVPDNAWGQWRPDAPGIRRPG